MSSSTTAYPTRPKVSLVYSKNDQVSSQIELRYSFVKTDFASKFHISLLKTSPNMFITVDLVLSVVETAFIASLRSKSHEKWSKQVY